MKQLTEHETSEDHEVQAGLHGRQALVVADEAAEAHTAGEVPFHDPAARQVHEAALGFWQLDHDDCIPYCAASAADWSLV